MTPAELDQFLTVLKAHGVTQAKIGDVQVMFAPDFNKLAEAFKPIEAPKEFDQLQFAHAQ